MSRKSLADTRREEILQGFARCIVKYGLDVSLEQIAAETGVKRSIIRHYIGNREEVVQALIERVTDAYLDDVRTNFATIAETRDEARFLDYLFDTDDEVLAWDRAIVHILITSSERYQSAKQSVQRMFSEALDLLGQVLSALFPAAPAEQTEQVGYALFCLATTYETVQWIGFQSLHRNKARASARSLLDTLRSAVSTAPHDMEAKR